MSEFAVILVHTTSEAIFTERILKAAGFDIKLIPTPRHLSSDCGSAVRILMSDKEDCLEALNEAGLVLDRIEPLEI